MVHSPRHACMCAADESGLVKKRKWKRRSGKSSWSERKNEEARGQSTAHKRPAWSNWFVAASFEKIPSEVVLKCIVALLLFFFLCVFLFFRLLILYFCVGRTVSGVVPWFPFVCFVCCLCLFVFLFVFVCICVCEATAPSCRARSCRSCEGCTTVRLDQCR